MPNPFRFFPLREFPDVRSGPYLVPTQLQIESQDAEDTVIRFMDSIAGPRGPLDRLELQHDVLVQAGGRAVLRSQDGEMRLEAFNQYIATHRLEAYLNEARDLLVIEGTGHVVNSAFRTLRDHADRITIAQGEVDFERLSPYLGRISGAWFSRPSGPVTALGMFGQNVAGSSEWEDATLNAEISSIMFQHLYDGEYRTVTITRDAGVVVYTNLPANQLLGLAFDIYWELIVPALKPADFARNRGTARRTGPTPT